MDLRGYCANNYGKQSDIARKIGVSCSYMNQMVTGYRPIPVEYCARIELATDGTVTRKDLRPDDWQEIWPELVEQQHET